METTVMQINGMTCSGCTNSVKKVLTAIDGVKSVDVRLDNGQATVMYDAARAQPAQFKQAVEDAGYEAA